MSEMEMNWAGVGVGVGVGARRSRHGQGGTRRRHILKIWFFFSFYTDVFLCAASIIPCPSLCIFQLIGLRIPFNFFGGGRRIF